MSSTMITSSQNRAKLHGDHEGLARTGIQTNGVNPNVAIQLMGHNSAAGSHTAYRGKQPPSMPQIPAVTQGGYQLLGMRLS